MNYTRTAIVLVRLLVAAVGGFYAALKIIKPEITPIYLLTPDDSNITMRLPAETNQTFANVLLGLVVLLALYIVIGTITSWVHETRRYGEGLPTARPGVVLAMVVSATLYSYYTIVGLLAGVTHWWYVVSLTIISWILVAYELKQSDDYDVL